MRIPIGQLFVITLILALNAPAHAQSGETYTWTSGCAGSILWLNNDCASCCECENWDPVTCSMTFMDTAIIPSGMAAALINSLEIGTIKASGAAIAIGNDLIVHNEATFGGSIDSSSQREIAALGPITFDGTFILSRGTLFGGGGFTVKEGSTLQLTPIGFGLSRILDTTTLQNNGTVNAELPLSFRFNAQAINAGLWKANATHGPTSAINQSGVFTNTGTVRHDVAGLHQFNIPLHNNGGTIEATNGTLNINRGGTHSSGKYTLSANDVTGVQGVIVLRGFDNNGTPDGVHITGPMTASGTGRLDVRGNRTSIKPGGSLEVDLHDAPLVGVGGFWVGGEANTHLQCDGPLTNKGLMGWASGTIEGSHPVVNQTGTLLFSAGESGTPTLKTLLLNGATVDQFASLRHDQHQITNAGTWKMNGGSLLSNTPAIFTNLGLLEKAAVLGFTSSVHSFYEDTGTTEAKSGVLSFRGGGKLAGTFKVQPYATINLESTSGTVHVTYELAGAKFEGAGTVVLGPTFSPVLHLARGSASKANVGGDEEDDGFILQSGSVSGPGVFQNDGKMRWSGGTIAVGAPVTPLSDGELLNKGIFTIPGGSSASRTLTGRLINGTGATMTAGVLTINDGGELLNFGTLQLNSGTIWTTSGVGRVWNGFLSTLRKTNTGTRTIQPLVTNFGTIEVLEGTLTLSGGVTNFQNGVLDGGNWVIKPGTTLNMPGASISGTAAGTFVRLEGGSSWTAMKNFLNDNQGTLQATGPGSTTIKPPGGVLQNTGTIQTAEGGTLDVDGDLDNFPKGFFDDLPGFDPLPGGGGGTAGVEPGGFIATTVNNHGTIRPGGESAPGPFNLTGDLVCHETSVIQIELAGLAPIDEHDQLNVTGDIALAGTLDLTLLDDFAPTKGTEFTIITATGGTITGEFDTITPPNFTVAYTRSTVTLTALAPQVPGDLNGDGVVGVADLLMLLSAWGTCADPANCPADFSPPGGDGAVGVADLLFLLANWG